MSGIGSSKTAIWLAAVIAFLNFLFSWLGLYLVDRVGRRKLLLASLAGVVISLGVLGGAFYMFHSNDHPVTFKEGSQAQHLTMCTERMSCMKCVQKDSCGFCYSLDPNGQPINSSCVAANSTMAAYGRCAGKRHPGFRLSFDVCPSKYAWIAVAGLALYIACFAPGMGPIPWTLNSEIFPLWARSAGTSCATAVNWGLNLLVSMTFLSLMQWISPHMTFWLYMSIAAVGWIFFFFSVPETKGKSLEELEHIFQ